MSAGKAYRWWLLGALVPLALSLPVYAAVNLESRIEALVRSHIDEGLALAGLKGEITMIKLPVKVAELPDRSDIAPQRVFITERAAGRHVIPLQVTPPEGRPVKIYVIVSTVAVVKAWVAHIPLKRGDALVAEKFTRKTIRVESRESDYIEDERLPTKYRMSSSLQPDQLLQFHHIEPVPDVERGDEVTIYFKRNGITLVSPGKARRRGQLGDIIPVMAHVTGKRLYGRLESPGVVIVE